MHGTILLCVPPSNIPMPTVLAPVWPHVKRVEDLGLQTYFGPPGAGLLPYRRGKMGNSLATQRVHEEIDDRVVVIENADEFSLDS